MQLLQLMHRFVNSRTGRICGWISFIAMVWMAIASLANLVLRRYSGQQFGLSDAFLLVIAFFAANAARSVYVIYIHRGRSRITEDK